MSNITNLMSLANVVNAMRVNNSEVKFYPNFTGAADIVNFVKAIIRNDGDLTMLPEEAKKYIGVLESSLTSQFIDVSLPYISKNSIEESITMPRNYTDILEFVYGFINAIAGGEVWSKKELASHLPGSDFFQKKEASRKIVNDRKLERNRQVLSDIEKMERSRNAEEQLTSYLQRRETIKALRDEILNS